MSAPSLNEIYDAELAFARAAQDTVNGVRRAQAALRERLARPSTLAGVAGAAMLAGFFVARRKKPEVQISGRRRIEKEPGPSTVALFMAFIMRQALARLPALLEQIWAAHRQQQVEAPAVGVPVTPGPRPVPHPPGRVFH
jgi:hypothetical protein